jgi:hypothetical protein
MAMRFAAIDEPAVLDLWAVEPRRMTPSQLRELGMPGLVYLRAGIVNGEPAYGIYAADGTVLSVVEDVELAIELVSEHGMTFVAVH